MPKALTIHAPAKVNLYLAVGDTRPDGYHNVETVLQSLDLSDTITLTESHSLELASDTELGIPAESNLAWRAAEALGRAVGRPPLFHIGLEKRIPHGAGLGGGSSDAAAVIAGAARLWGMEPDDPVLAIVASSIGADVPFFLDGGTALFVGRGDEYLSSLPTPDLSLVLVRPPVSIATAEAYAAFDRLEQEDPPGSVGMVRACESGDAEGVSSALFNSMTTAAITLDSSIEEAIAWLRDFGDVSGALLAGSGSAGFGICSSGESASALASAAREMGWWAEATRTRRTGIEITQAEVRT